MSWAGCCRRHSVAWVITAAVALAVMVAAGSGCASPVDQPATESTPTGATSPGTTSTSPAGTETSYDVRCLPVAADLARRIASGQRKAVGMVPGWARAVKSPDLEGAHLVALQFTVSGVAETQLGFWAVTSPVSVDDHGPIRAVGRSAQRVTRWPLLRYSSADVRHRVEATVGDSAACLLR